MTSFTAEIKPVFACMCMSFDVPGNINRGWNSSVTVESINDSVLSHNSFFLFLPTPLLSSNSNHRQHLFLPPHCASPYSLQTSSKVSWKTPKDMHILSFGTAYERWKLKLMHAAAAITLKGEMVAASFEGGRKARCTSKLREHQRGYTPCKFTVCKRQSLMSGYNRDGTWSWCDVKKQLWFLLLKSIRKKIQRKRLIIIGNPED